MLSIYCMKAFHIGDKCTPLIRSRFYNTLTKQLTPFRIPRRPSPKAKSACPAWKQTELWDMRLVKINIFKIMNCIRHMNDTPLEWKSNQSRIIRLTESNLIPKSTLFHFAVFNWFRRRTNHELNSSIEFGAWIIRRLKRGLHLFQTAY